MMIDSGSESDAEANAKRAGADVAGTAYRESMTSVDGFTRGANGRVKFNKDTKKRRRENEEVEEDVEMADGDKGKKHKRKPSAVKLGHEFKAKVNSFDPVLYIRLVDLFSTPRKLEGTLKRVVWILTHTCRWEKPRRGEEKEDSQRLVL